MHILDILQSLKAQTGAGSAGRKMEILVENEGNSDLRSFFMWALDPNINYWQSKITKSDALALEFEGVGDHSITSAMAEIWRDLVSRNVTGNKAKRLLSEIYYYLEDPKDREILDRIITGKPDIGCGVGTLNKVWDELIYDPAYMRCKGYSPKLVKDWDFENEVIYSDLKADGMFDNMILGDQVEFETRSGESLPKVVNSLDLSYFQALEKIKSYLTIYGEVKDPVLHGEFLVIKDGEIMERSKGNGLINKVKLGGAFPKNHYIRLVIWDYIPKENFLSHEEYPVTYDVKFDLLTEIFSQMEDDQVQLIEYKRVKSMMEAQRHFVECLQAGFEGTVLKNASRLTWKNHTSPNQLKLKNKFRFEMRVTGFTEGEGKFAPTFGSMEIISECGLLISSISGIKDKLRKEIHENRSDYMDNVVEVEANGLFVNDDGSYGIMHGRFKELRQDRVEADALERIIQQEIDSITGSGIESKNKLLIEELEKDE